MTYNDDVIEPKWDAISLPIDQNISLSHIVRREMITYLNTPQEEKEGIDELQKEKLKKLRLAKRAESLKQGRKKFAANYQDSLGQSYQFARHFLLPRPKGELESTK